MPAPAGSLGGPLTGVRVVEFDAIGPVPLAGMILADYGCDVVRIMRPGRVEGPSADGVIIGRGRRCLTLDLKSPADRQTALRMISHAEILLEGHRPGVMERLGLGPEACIAANRRLVYGRMTGWGQTGPLAQAAGHDINYIALTGVLHAIGGVDRPMPPLNLVGDYGAGTLLLVLGAVAALVSARATGEGQVVDAAMTDGSALLMSMFYGMHAAGSWRDARECNLLDGGAPFYRTYACRDGEHIAVGAIEPAFFVQLVKGLGLDPAEFEQDHAPGWPTMAERFAAQFRERTRDEWAYAFAATDACVTPVLSLAQAPSDPHNRARRTFASPAGVEQPMPAPRFSATPATLRSSEETTASAVLHDWSP